MENKSLSKKFGVKKIKSMLKVFTNEKKLFFFVIHSLFEALFIIFFIIFLLFYFKVVDKLFDFDEIVYIDIIVILLLCWIIVVVFIYTNWFGILNLYYSKQKIKYSGSTKVLKVYNELGEKHNLNFKELFFGRIAILPSCSDTTNISLSKNLNSKYTFTKNGKEYNLVFGKIKYITQSNGLDFYRELLLEVNLYETSSGKKLNHKKKNENKNSVLNNDSDLNNFELSGIKGVSFKKRSNLFFRFIAFIFGLTIIMSGGNGDIDVFTKLDKNISKKTNGWSWEGYTYWNKNMKQWRKDYLQESYRLPGVWCNNDVEAKDMDEYIEKKINFECQLINDIFDNFEIDDLSIDNN